jgi:hypothetical protein
MLNICKARRHMKVVCHQTYWVLKFWDFNKAPLCHFRDAATRKVGVIFTTCHIIKFHDTE